MQLSYCALQVRTHDHDRYLCALFAPAEVREAWFALFAFNHEIATIDEVVSEEMIGLIRFAWWREALDEIYGGAKVRKHPVAEALAEVIVAHKLPRGLFDRILEARAGQLHAEPIEELPALETYITDTSSTLLELCALTAGMPFDAALSDLGLAWGLIGTLRAKTSLVAEPVLLEAAMRYTRQARGAWAADKRVFAPFLHASEYRLKRPHSVNDHLRLTWTLLCRNLW